MAFPSRSEYESLIYGIQDAHPDTISSSTLRLISTSALTARLEGDVVFANGVLLKILEFIDFRIGEIRDYSYTVFHNSEKS